VGKGKRVKGMIFRNDFFAGKGRLSGCDDGGVGHVHVGRAVFLEQAGVIALGKSVIG
jgi:hypothetical protein